MSTNSELLDFPFPSTLGFASKGRIWEQGQACFCGRDLALLSVALS
jgi:hypothetical protein